MSVISHCLESKFEVSEVAMSMPVAYGLQRGAELQVCGLAGLLKAHVGS